MHVVPMFFTINKTVLSSIWSNSPALMLYFEGNFFHFQEPGVDHPVPMRNHILPNFYHLQESGQTKCQCPTGFRGDGINSCEGEIPFSSNSQNWSISGKKSLCSHPPLVNLSLDRSFFFPQMWMNVKKRGPASAPNAAAGTPGAATIAPAVGISCTSGTMMPASVIILSFYLWNFFLCIYNSQFADPLRWSTQQRRGRSSQTPHG